MGENMGRAAYRRHIVEADNTTEAILYVGDGLHRLAKAFEMLLDPEQVEARRFKRDENGKPEQEEAAA